MDRHIINTHRPAPQPQQPQQPQQPTTNNRQPTTTHKHTNTQTHTTYNNTQQQNTTTTMTTTTTTTYYTRGTCAHLSGSVSVDVFRASFVYTSVIAPSFPNDFNEVQASMYPSLSTVQQQRSAFRVGETVSSHTTHPAVQCFSCWSRCHRTQPSSASSVQATVVVSSTDLVATGHRVQCEAMNELCWARVGGGNPFQGCWCGVVTRREPVRAALSVLPHSVNQVYVCICEVVPRFVLWSWAA